MARYVLQDNKIKQVTAIKIGSVFCVNPTDEQIDEAGAGYPLLITPKPEGLNLVEVYDVVDGSIVQGWEVNTL